MKFSALKMKQLHNLTKVALMMLQQIIIIVIIIIKIRKMVLIIIIIKIRKMVLIILDWLKNDRKHYYYIQF